MICAWAHVDGSTRRQYSAYVATTAARLSTRAWHFEVESNPSLEFENSPRANVFTIFEDPRADLANDATDYLLDFARGAPEHIRIDVRRFKELPEAFQQDYWAGSYDNLDFLVVGTLHLRDAAISKEYFDWTRSELVPNMMSTDEFLRGRYFTATRTLLAESATPVERTECANTLVLFELNSDDILWDKFVDVATSQRWLRMEPHLEFEMNKWFLKQCFGGDGQLLHATAAADDE